MRNLFIHKSKEGLYFTFIIGLFLAGYVFFFSSRLWMPATADGKTYTELNRVQKWNDREITIMRWDFDKDNMVMEVELDITNNSYDGKNNYDFECIDNSGKHLSIEKIVETPEWIILRLADIPKRWSELSLRIMMQNDHDTLFKIYTNVNDVTYVDELRKKTVREYRIDRLNLEKDNYMDEIKNHNKEILRLQKETEEINAEIDRLEAEKLYQTDAQIADTDRKISDARSKIAEDQTLILELSADNEELQKRIDKINEQIEGM